MPSGGTGTSTPTSTTSIGREGEYGFSSHAVRPVSFGGFVVVINLLLCRLGRSAMKMLVVDHDSELRDLLAYMLRRHGYAVVTASDAAQALEHWREHAPDIVLLDPALPQGDGLAVCRQIHQASATPVILVTARGSDDDVRRGLAAGASDYVIKPFSPQQLMARIQLVLQRTLRDQRCPRD